MNTKWLIGITLGIAAVAFGVFAAAYPTPTLSGGTPLLLAQGPGGGGDGGPGGDGDGGPGN